MGTPYEGRRDPSREGELRRELRYASGLREVKNEELPWSAWLTERSGTTTDQKVTRIELGSSDRTTDHTMDLTYDVPVFVNEEIVLDSARRELAREPVPATCAEANERVKHLAIKFYPVREQGAHAIAAVCPLRGEEGIPSLPWDAATVGLTAEFGGIDAAAMDAARRAMAGRDDWTAKATRCLAGGFLVCLMPTSVVGMTASLLSEAVRNINAEKKGEAVEETRPAKARGDFFQGLAFSGLLGQWEDLLKS